MHPARIQRARGRVRRNPAPWFPGTKVLIFFYYLRVKIAGATKKLSFTTRRLFPALNILTAHMHPARIQLARGRTVPQLCEIVKSVSNFFSLTV